MRAPAEVLDEQAQLQLRQALVLRLRVLVPAFFVPTALSGIAVTVLDGSAPGFWFRCAGVARPTHLDRDQGHWHCPDQQCDTHLAARRAAKELESARRPRGALPLSGCLGGGPGVRLLLNGHGTQACRFVTSEKTAVHTSIGFSGEVAVFLGGTSALHVLERVTKKRCGPMVVYRDIAHDNMKGGIRMEQRQTRAYSKLYKD